MDALLADLQTVCSELLPILGAVALVFLCIFLKKLADLMDTLSSTVKSLDPTLQKVNQSLDKVQAPLDTAVKYSHTLDKVHDKAGDLMDRAAEMASEGAARFQAMQAMKEEETTVTPTETHTDKEAEHE